MFNANCGVPVTETVSLRLTVAVTTSPAFKVLLKAPVAEVMATLLMVGAQRLMLHRKGFISQTGKGGERRPIELGGWRWGLLGWCLCVALLTVVMPVIVLGEASFARAWGRGPTADNLTLANYKFLLFQHETALSTIWNTLWFSAAAATGAVLIALLVAYIVGRRLVRFGGVLAFLAMAPFVIPGIVMAIGFYASFAAPPFALYGTAAIIILAFISRFLPIAYANASSAIATLHPEMEEAARILGCGRLATIARITAPLLKKSLLGGWLIVFIVATRELSAAIFLVGPKTRTMAVLLYDLSEAGNFEVLAALGGILLVVTVALVGVGMKLLGRDFMLRRA